MVGLNQSMSDDAKLQNIYQRYAYKDLIFLVKNVIIECEVIP